LGNSDRAASLQQKARVLVERRNADMSDFETSEKAQTTPMLEPRGCKVALLSGGSSGEREVSLASGKGAQQALEAAGFLVTMLDPSCKDDLKALIDGDFDIAFLCLHGKGGEDGAMQGFLEVIGLPYTGSGIWSSALSIDKAKAKVFYQSAGIKTPESMTIGNPAQASLRTVVEDLGLPCVVKPVCEGSALGVYIVETEDELQKALNDLSSISSNALVERFVSGRELTVAVLGNEKPEALPVIEIIPQNEFYDYESKYSPGGSQHLCPAPIGEQATKDVQQMAIAAHVALGCSGVSRSDFILDEAGELWILETNTIPGMTKTSLLPDAGRAAQIGFSDLCVRLIAYALAGRK
jgi:D-alanine-D-alanine ligase